MEHSRRLYKTFLQKNPGWNEHIPRRWNIMRWDISRGGSASAAENEDRGFAKGTKPTSQVKRKPASSWDSCVRLGSRCLGFLFGRFYPLICQMKSRWEPWLASGCIIRGLGPESPPSQWSPFPHTSPPLSKLKGRNSVPQWPQHQGRLLESWLPSWRKASPRNYTWKHGILAVGQC